MNELLRRMHEQGRYLHVEVVARREHGTERQVVQVREIDLVASFHFAEQLRLQHKGKENVDRQHVMK